MKINLYHRYGKYQKEGRGLGSGKDYKPYITVRDLKKSPGRTTRVLGWKTGRVHHLLSDLETKYFYIVEWSDSVTDIREQYPLNPGETVVIAARLGIKHPMYQNQLVIMTTDFLISIGNNQIARNCKYSVDQYKERNIEKALIEEHYWKSKGVPFGVINEISFDHVLARNVAIVHGAYNIHGRYPELKINDLNILEHIFKDRLQKKYTPVQAASEIDNIFGFREGTSLYLYKHFVATKKIRLNMNIPFDTNKPII